MDRARVRATSLSSVPPVSSASPIDRGVTSGRELSTLDPRLSTETQDPRLTTHDKTAGSVRLRPVGVDDVLILGPVLLLARLGARSVVAGRRAGIGRRRSCLALVEV